MRQNALLRSGKRAAARSPQQAVSAAGGSTSVDDRRDAFVTRDGARYAGVHLIIDLHGAKRLNDLDYIEGVLRRCAEAAGATLLHIHLHRFQPDGVSGVAVLAESHISIHTRPEARYAALGVFMWGGTDPSQCAPVLRAAVSARPAARNKLLRGQVTERMSRHGGRRFAGKDADRGAGGPTVPGRRTPMSDERVGGRWVAERLFDRIGLRMTFAAGRVLDERRTAYQDLLLFEHRHLGKVLMLDGALQLTGGDEFIYHEMMAHVPILAHGRAREVLIIGGGDCGIAEEALKHKSVARVTQVEIDAAVVELARAHFPELAGPALADKRFDLVVAD